VLATSTTTRSPRRCAETVIVPRGRVVVAGAGRKRNVAVWCVERDVSGSRPERCIGRDLIPIERGAVGKDEGLNAVVVGGVEVAR